MRAISAEATLPLGRGLITSGAARGALVPCMSVEPMYTVPPIIMARAMSTAPTITVLW